MQIARRLATELDAQPGFRPVLIRDTDTFVSLRERTERARAASADFFISIHADAFANSSARGATVYVLSQKGASDEAGRPCSPVPARCRRLTHAVSEDQNARWSVLAGRSSARGQSGCRTHNA